MSNFKTLTIVSEGDMNTELQVFYNRQESCTISIKETDIMEYPIYVMLDSDDIDELIKELKSIKEQM